MQPLRRAVHFFPYSRSHCLSGARRLFFKNSPVFPPFGFFFAPPHTQRCFCAATNVFILAWLRRKCTVNQNDIVVRRTAKARENRKNCEKCKKTRERIEKRKSSEKWRFPWEVTFDVFRVWTLRLWFFLFLLVKSRFCVSFNFFNIW